MMKLGLPKARVILVSTTIRKEIFEQLFMETTSQQLGSYENIKWLHESLGKEWMVAERGILGPPGTPNPRYQSFEQGYFMER